MIKQGLWAVKKWMAFAERRYQIAKYAKFGPDHIFDIKVDDLSIKLTFLDRPIGNAMVERIQGRREPTTVTAIRALVKPGSKVLELVGATATLLILWLAVRGRKVKWCRLKALLIIIVYCRETSNSIILKMWRSITCSLPTRRTTLLHVRRA